MDSLAFSLFSLKGQFSASITPWGVVNAFPSSHRVKSGRVLCGESFEKPMESTSRLSGGQVAFSWRGVTQMVWETLQAAPWGQGAVIPAAGGQGKEAAGATAAALAGTDLESPTRAALGTSLREEVYLSAIQAGVVKSPLK